jgi:nicotinamidase-related amidase
MKRDIHELNLSTDSSLHTDQTSMPASALLVIDVQMGLFTPPTLVYKGSQLLERIKAVLMQARRTQVPVVFIQDKDVAPVGSEGWEIHPQLEVFASDARVDKSHADAFYQTPLFKMLETWGTNRLVVVGCTTDACIAATCRSGVALGFDVVLVEDAHSTRDNSFLNAAQSIAYYNLTLDGFGIEDSIGFGAHGISLATAGDVLFS